MTDEINYFDNKMNPEIAENYGSDMIRRVKDLHELIQRVGIKKSEKRIRMYNSLSSRTEKALSFLKEHNPELYEQLHTAQKYIKELKKELNSKSDKEIPNS